MYRASSAASSKILPIRASAYILSILNEQVGKGAMALYLHRRHGVPGWEVGSSMLFIMFCEFYYLLFWALIGWTISRDVLAGNADNAKLTDRLGKMDIQGPAAAEFIKDTLGINRVATIHGVLGDLLDTLGRPDEARLQWGRSLDLVAQHH